MRDLEFRSWSELLKKYVCDGFHFFGEWLTFEGFEQTINENWDLFSKKYECRMLAVNDFIIEQFTGLFDKNGKKAFDGDIVTGKFQYAKKCIVIWDNKRCGFFLKPLDGLGKAAYDKYYKMNSTKIEIIGNIHENPELLEK